LLEPAVQLKIDIIAAAIGYSARRAEESELCWYGDAPFLPHLLRTLAYSEICVHVEFFPDRAAYSDRKVAALELHEQVEAMRKRIRREVA